VYGLRSAHPLALGEMGGGGGWGVTRTVGIGRA
jgi:hypothetical protein